jgi:hypothetical protein
MSSAPVSFPIPQIELGVRAEIRKPNSRLDSIRILLADTTTAWVC